MGASRGIRVAFLEGGRACQVGTQEGVERMPWVVQPLPVRLGPLVQRPAQTCSHSRLCMISPAPRGMPRPAGTPFPGPAANPLLSSPAVGGGPSTVTLTIDSPRRMTRPSVRFCCTDGAASVGLASFAFFPCDSNVSHTPLYSTKRE